MNKRLFTALLAACLSVSFLFSSCASGEAEDTSADTSAETQAETQTETEQKDTKVTITYPANMQERGFTEPLVLEKQPERVAVMSKAPVYALYELGVQMIAVPKSGMMAWPADLDAATTKLETGMNSNFDIETVIALEPDLVIMGYHSADTYGKALDDAEIPVYYVDAGHTVPYSSTRMQTEAFVQAFGASSEKGQEIMKRFEELENRMNDLRAKYEGKTVMVLQSSPPNHYIQTAEGTLASMADMLGFKNVYENDQSSMAPLDMENALSYDPDLILAVGGSQKAEDHQKLMEEDFANNPDYWNSISAVAEGRVLYFPISFIASNGIGVLDNMDQFISMVEAFYAE